MGRIATQLRGHRRTAFVVVACVAFAVVAALVSVCSVSLSPTGLHPRDVQVAGATTRVLVDSGRSAITSRFSVTTTFTSLTQRAALLGELMVSDPVRTRIADAAGIPPQQLAAVARVTANVPATLTEPDSEQRADEIARSRKPYLLDVQPRPTVPVIDVYTKAPTPMEAGRLADAAVAGLRDHLNESAIAQGLPPEDRAVLHQLGPSKGTVINGGARFVIAGLTFLVALAFAAGAWMGIERIRRGWSAPTRTTPAPDAQRGRLPSGAPRVRSGGVWTRPQPTSAMTAMTASGSAALRPGMPVWTLDRTRLARIRAAVSHGGDWPRTTRVLPWLIAAFIAMLWLVPFNQIALNASLPIDLKLDRLVLPVIFLAWILALASGGAGAPRLRFSGIHAGLAVFGLVACLSVVLNAGYLNQILELDLALKKLTLLFSYVWLFVIVASSIRRGEVRAFMTYTLVLAVICAIGTIWEYRFRYNVFYDWSDKLLPGIFTVGQAESGAVDEIGRRLVRGPAEIGLEAVAMFTVALPVALVGLLERGTRRRRLLHALAACLLLAASTSTARKSAFLGPASVALVIAYFRRRDLIKLAPLGLVVLGLVHALSPGALGSILFQLDANRLGVATVSDRVSDYDAVRPDLWTHMALGRGYGTYEHTAYRVLDSEFLNRLLEVGVIGLLAYVGIFLCVVGTARASIRSGHFLRSSTALAVAAAAVGFLVLSGLFDIMSFPHVPYIFLSLAGLLAVVVRPPPDAP